MSKLWVGCVCAVLLVGCTSEKGTTSVKQPAAAAVHTSEVAADLAELYVFNISGWTLIPSNQDIIDNGKLLASLPRLTYTVVRVPPGAHELRLHGRRLVLNIEQGKQYFVVAGYRPERSWAFPLGGDPVQIKQITKEQARPLLQQLTAR